jgi:Fe-Mn family superoxide dismutase
MNGNRRQVLVAGGLGVLAGTGAHAQPGARQVSPAGGVPGGKHQIVPLPFDPKKLRGLSERLLISHHENNYGGALKSLNKVEDEIARTTKDSPGFVVSGLRERELQFTNSVILHEHYFANLGGAGKPGGGIEKALAQTFGTFARFEELFRAAGMSLAGGSGWALLALNFQSGDLRIVWSGNHTQALSFGAPLLVLDMYEHAYHIDFGAAAAKYLEAFWGNIDWAMVDRRYDRALKASTALRA